MGRTPRVLAQEVTCPPAATPEAVEAAPLTGKKIGVTVAYLFVPFYANFKKGLEDGARDFGFEYDLQDGEGKPEVELANMQDFITQGVDLILLTPMSDGTKPSIALANEAGIPSSRSTTGRGSVATRPPS